MDNVGHGRTSEPATAFTVGEWRVDPSLNQISRDGVTTTLQPKVMRLLETLAGSPGVAIDRQAIIDKLWPGQVVTDSSLYQAVANLRKALGDSAPDRAYIEAVSSRGYRLIAPVGKAPVALKPGQSRHRNRLRTRHFAIAVASILIAVVIILSLSIRGTSDNTAVAGAEKLERLMVVPFTSTGSNTDRTIIASLQEALLTHLVRVGDVQIIEGSGDALASNVDGYVHGSVQSEGRSLRVYLRLTRAADQAVLWGEQFESPADALFNLQDQVAKGLLAAIGHHSQEQVFHAESVEAGAFADYLEGRVLWAERSESSLNRAEKIFLSVIERAPRFAQAYVGLCDTYFFSSVYQNRTLNEALSACLPLLERALVLHPDLGEALATKALFVAQQGDDETANALFEKAIQNAPNYAFARMWYGNHLRRQGALTKAQVQHELAIELAPFSPIVRRNLAYVLLNQGQVPAARRAYAEALELEPDYSSRAVNELDFFSLTVDRAVNFLRWTQHHPDQYRQNPDAQLSKAMVQLALNDVTAATKTVDEAAAHPHVDASYLLYAKGVIALAQGDYATAQQWLYERTQLGRREQHFVLPYIGALRAGGDLETARMLAEETIVPGDGLTITEENHYPLIGYIRMLMTDGEVEEAHRWMQSMNAFMETHFDDTDLNHLEWLAMSGQPEAAKHAAGEIVNSGWLPSYSSEPFGALQMSGLLGLSAAEFERLMEHNREQVRQAMLEGQATLKTIAPRHPTLKQDSASTGRE